MPDVPSYRAAQLAARRRMGRLDASAARAIGLTLDTYAAELANSLQDELSPLRPLDAQREAATIAARVTIQTRDVLFTTLRTATESHRLISFESIMSIAQDQLLKIAAARNVPEAIIGAIRVPPLTMLGAFENITGGYHWKARLQHASFNASDEIRQIIRAGITEGIGADELARRLRRYVAGSEPFDALFQSVPTLSGDVAKIDLGRIPSHLRDAARTMRYNAERIAFTEIHNARAEAEIQMFEADPTIGAVQWVLSPNRGRMKPPDICDAFAKYDFYGLGAGVFPVARVPAPPHPFDRCERIPVFRDGPDWGMPKAAPPRMQMVTADWIRNSLRVDKRITEKRALTIVRDTQAFLQLMDEQLAERFNRLRDAA